MHGLPRNEFAFFTFFSLPATYMAFAVSFSTLLIFGLCLVVLIKEKGLEKGMAFKGKDV